MYYIQKKLGGSPIGKDALKQYALTHTAWFPDIQWKGALPNDIPNQGFILDIRHLNNPEKQLRSILSQSKPDAPTWTDLHINNLMETLAPEAKMLLPMSTVIGRIRDKVFKMTEGQLKAYRALRRQKRLLVEGCAGSGKTLLAMSLAREHLQDEKKVLFTCYNKLLAAQVALQFEGYENFDAINFHELTEKLCIEHGIEYKVPEDYKDWGQFFAEDSAYLLAQAGEKMFDKYDTILVDEALDFRDAWWLSLETVAKDEFSYYLFYDKNQEIFNSADAWSPPFEGEPHPLETNIRNTRPVGEYACKIGKVFDEIEYSIEKGPKPKVMAYKSAEELPGILKNLINELKREKIALEDVVILSPYTYKNKRLGLEEYIQQNEALFGFDMLQGKPGQIRIGTIQGFKGLEADVVILLGLDGHEQACKPANLYVGASRARSMLYVVHQEGVELY